MVLTKHVKVEYLMVNQLRALTSGVIYSFLVMMIASVILAALLRFTNMFTSHYTFISITIGCIALCIGGIVAGKKGASKGWLLGALMSGCIILIAFVIQLFVTKAPIEGMQCSYYALYILFGTFGGIIGVHFANED